MKRLVIGFVALFAVGIFAATVYSETSTRPSVTGEMDLSSDEFNDAVLNTSLSSGMDSHTAGSDTSGKITRNSGNIATYDIEEGSVHVQGKDYTFAAATTVDPEFGAGENDVWIGYGATGFVKQADEFTTVQKRTIMPIARIQAAAGQTGPGSDISAVGILDHRHLISENGYRESVYLEGAIGTLFESGGLISENGTTDRNLDISSGVMWTHHRAKQTWPGFQNVSGLHLRHSSGTWIASPALLKMDNVNYDDGTDVTAMTNNNYYCSHTILMSPRGTQDAEFDSLRLFWIHCQDEFNSQQGAIDAGLDFGPFIDQTTSGLVPLAQVIVKKNTANLISIIDARPRIGSAGGSITTGTVTQQGAYNNGSDIILNGVQGAMTISDNATPVGDMFNVNSFSNATSYFKVSPIEVAVPDGTYAQFGNYSGGVPASADCDADSERGRQYIDSSNNRFYVCNGSSRGWDYLSLTD